MKIFSRGRVPIILPGRIFVKGKTQEIFIQCKKKKKKKKNNSPLIIHPGLVKVKQKIMKIF